MSEPAAHALPPHAQLIQMVTAYWVSVMVYAAAKLGLADHLAAGPEAPRSWPAPRAPMRRRCTG